MIVAIRPIFPNKDKAQVIRAKLPVDLSLKTSLIWDMREVQTRLLSRKILNSDWTIILFSTTKAGIFSGSVIKYAAAIMPTNDTKYTILFPVPNSTNNKMITNICAPMNTFSPYRLKGLPL